MVMAILNVTPDSFYAASRLSGPSEVVEAAQRALQDGAHILDIGACSTRPGVEFASADEEWRRLEPVLYALRDQMPDAALSLDTFRPEIAQRALDICSTMIINDISGGCEAMYELVRHYRVPYVWTLRGDLSLPARRPDMQDIDLILDPGLGFTGGVESDYACLRRLDELNAYGLPVLVGVSRKSMIYRPLCLTPDTCGEATQALHMYALMHGATILRTHDVAATVRTVTLWQMTR